MKNANSNPRSVINLIKSQYKEAVESNLRLETALSTAANTVVKFNTRQDVGVKTANEIRLKSGDAFVITSMAMFISRIAVAVANTPTAEEQAQMIKRTYPNTLIYTVGAEAAAQMALYNGNTLIKVNKKDVVPSVRNYSFYRVPTVQQLTGPAQAFVRDGWDGANYGYKTMNPTITIRGNDDVDISIQMGGSVIAGAAGLFMNYAILEFDGVLIPQAVLKGKQIWEY